MPSEEIEVTEAQALQQQRSASFGARTAERIRGTENCLFSLLPHEELSRRAAGWYEACAQGMLRGNYAPISEWIRAQLPLAKGEGFVREDILQLLQICRRSAIELEGWNEDILSSLDEVIDEIVGGSGTKIANSSKKIKEPVYSSSRAGTNGQADRIKGQRNERRSFDRNRLRLPIRVRGTGDRDKSEEIIYTQSISRGGLYFVSRQEWRAEEILKIVYPYWTEANSINTEYVAKVVRVDCLSDGAWGVAVEFLQNLGRKADRR
jgi:PilZ domain